MNEGGFGEGVRLSFFSHPITGAEAGNLILCSIQPEGGRPTTLNYRPGVVETAVAALWPSGSVCSSV